MLNNDYKIISSVINRRVKSILPSAILPTQTGFVPGRLITENVITILEVMRRSPDWIIALIDIEKAFDSISHKFIHHILHRIELPAKMRHVIKQLLQKSTVQVLVNGNLTHPIPIMTSLMYADDTAIIGNNVRSFLFI